MPTGGMETSQVMDVNNDASSKETGIGLSRSYVTHSDLESFANVTGKEKSAKSPLVVKESYSKKGKAVKKESPMKKYTFPSKKASPIKTTSFMLDHSYASVKSASTPKSFSQAEKKAHKKAITSSRQVLKDKAKESKNPLKKLQCRLTDSWDALTLPDRMKEKSFKV